MLTPEQQAVVDYITANPDAISKDGPGGTKTLTQWYNLDTTDGDNIVAEILNSQDIGAEHEKTCSRVSISSAAVRAAIFNSESMGQMTAAPGVIDTISFALEGGSFQLKTSGAVQEMASGMNGLLENSYVAANNAFNALKKRPSSIYESLLDQEGATISHSDIYGLRHPA